MTKPVTLGDLARASKLLWVYCCDYGRERDLDPATVPLPPESPVPSVGRAVSTLASSWPCTSAAKRCQTTQGTLSRISSGKTSTPAKFQALLQSRI